MSPVLRQLICWMGWLTVVSAHAESSLSTQAIALNCQTCHLQAAGDNLLPELGKISRQQLRQSLLDFKYTDNAATIMPRLVKGYSDDELLAVADYLAPQ
jgi:sulfide dehydrogenase cytochrome subunit